VGYVNLLATCFERLIGLRLRCNEKELDCSYLCRHHADLVLRTGTRRNPPPQPGAPPHTPAVAMPIPGVHDPAEGDFRRRTVIVPPPHAA